MFLLVLPWRGETQRGSANDGFRNFISQAKPSHKSGCGYGLAQSAKGAGHGMSSEKEIDYKTTILSEFTF